MLFTQSNENLSILGSNHKFGKGCSRQSGVCSDPITTLLRIPDCSKPLLKTYIMLFITVPFYDDAFIYFFKCPNALYTYFVFAVTEKWTCQSKCGKCSLTSENSLFKLVRWPRAEYSKCLNTEWGIYEKRGYVVLHSKEALHSLKKESGNVDLYALEYAHTYIVARTRMCTCARIHKQKETQTQHST